MTPTLRAFLFADIEDLGGCCPVQGEGVIRVLGETRRFYFRARGSSWSFGVGVTDDDAVGAAMGLATGFHRREAWGKGEFDAGFMPLDIAREFIYRCVEEFLQESNHEK